MAKFIDLEKIKPIDFPSTEMDGLDVVQYLNKLPTVDAVKVVRCKDCKWRNTRGCPYLNFNSCARDDLDFCSDGERKTDG